MGSSNFIPNLNPCFSEISTILFHNWLGVKNWLDFYYLFLLYFYVEMKAYGSNALYLLIFDAE